VAAQEQGLLPLNQMSMQFFGRTSYHDYEGIALDLDERERLVRDLGNNNAMILRHHGLLTAGRTVGDAFYEMYYLEQACRLQVAATQGGQKVLVPPDSVAERAAQQFESFESKGQRPWAALKRRLDRDSPDYAT
jgi:ribulose-5-phosphate 4-epimerase/fuculose-1-phosphate aldolase